MGLDTVFIKDLLLRCIIGVYPEERKKAQDVIINVEMEADLHEACRSDRIEDAVDYKRIKQGILKEIEPSSYQLVEALAGKVAEICLRDERVMRVTVTVEKPGAARFSKSVGVRIMREREWI